MEQMEQMDFREHQDHAKKNSNKIWMLYALLLLTSSFLTGLLFGGYLVVDGYLELWSADYFSVSLGFSIIALVILVVSTLFGFFKNSNGKKVAEMFGGQLITHEGVRESQAEKGFFSNIKNTESELRELTKEENRALNIIEELSLAAAIKVPPLYLIPDDAINAFAAGKSKDNAIVGITRGALAAFDRKEMTGIIAHELGHIVSDDVKLNIRVSALVYGFTAIYVIGHWMMRGAIYGDSDLKGKIIKIGLSLALLAVGALTVFFGRILQAAMSRQREYLADASAIQFTRHPDGLESAFNKLNNDKEANTKIEAGEAGDYSHAFIFGIGGEIMATHPPLEDRIARLKKRVV